MSKLLLETINLSKNYDSNPVLSNINLSLKTGESLAIIGPSGSGKSTLLHSLGLLDNITSGQILFNGENIDQYSDKKKTLIRRNDIGFVYQFHYLINELTVLENILLPYKLKFFSYNYDIVDNVMKKFGIYNQKDYYPYQISGGQRQRTAIARALITSPKLVIADEPTGNLDQENADLIKNDLINITKQSRTSLILATHDKKFAECCSGILNLR